jgi:hypothetical protein
LQKSIEEKLARLAQERAAIRVQIEQHRPGILEVLICGWISMGMDDVAGCIDPCGGSTAVVWVGR